MVFSKQYDIIHSVDTEERQVLMGSKVTFDDIAAYTHFSKTTISRYFNNPESVTLQNRKIISDALEALNYKNNKVARILANGKSEFIGIIIPHFEHQFYSSIVQHLIISLLFFLEKKIQIRKENISVNYYLIKLKD